MKREFLLLAHKFDREKVSPAGYFMSEKLDGQRMYWDGGITTGMIKNEVPWANTLKDGRYRDVQISTGLWSRYGHVIHAPDWWIKELPRIPLDGEVFYRRGDGGRQEGNSIVKQLSPNDNWENISYACFETPSYETIFADGEIDTTNFMKQFKGINKWITEKRLLNTVEYQPKPNTPFMSTWIMLQRFLGDGDGQGNGQQKCKYAFAHPQEQLPFSTDEANQRILERLDQITASGGEGLMLRNPSSYWVPGRSHQLLKVKKLDDMEGVVTGYTTGRETEKGSKLRGLMGALIVEIPYQFGGNRRLELSGFTEEERRLGRVKDTDTALPSPYEWAWNHPEQEVPEWIEAIHFPRGMKITFKYRGLSNDGIPQEARFWRERTEH